MFKFNKLLSYEDLLLEKGGFGTVSFFGTMLYIENCLFIENRNYDGGALYLDTGYYLLLMEITIKNSVFQNNSAKRGSGLFFGSNIWKINATLKNIQCVSNQAQKSLIFI